MLWQSLGYSIDSSELKAPESLKGAFAGSRALMGRQCYKGSFRTIGRGLRIYIALATTDFVLYQDLVKELRERRLKFVTVAPSESIAREVGVVITSEKEAGMITFPNIVVASDPEMTVNEAIRRLRNGAQPGRAIIGIDPGREPGIAVVCNNVVEAVYRVPMRQAFDVIDNISHRYPDILVRVGHGARMVSTHLINTLVAQGIAVELVDESRTSPYLGRGTGGSAISDIVAAINIAHTRGKRMGRQALHPSKGEIRSIQERSRELSDGRTTISRQLAEKVAKGEITINQALAEHVGAETSENY